jgi:protein phosphatase PTC1
MPTRTIGDHEFTPVGLSSKPYVREMILAKEGWIVTACDGLWDVVKAWELPALLKDFPEPADAVQHLLSEAITERNGTDNVSIIVVKYTPVGSEKYATATISDTLVDEKVA